MTDKPQRRVRVKTTGSAMKEDDSETAGVGHNSGEATLSDQQVAVGQLRAFIERVERLEEEKKTISDDIREVYAEVKGTGFDVKAVRTIVRLRKMDQAERQEREAILDLYKAGLGMA